MNDYKVTAEYSGGKHKDFYFNSERDIFVFLARFKEYGNVFRFVFSRLNGTRYEPYDSIVVGD